MSMLDSGFRRNDKLNYFAANVILSLSNQKMGCQAGFRAF